MTYRESADDPEYRLIIAETVRMTSGPATLDLAYAPVTTISGCKRLYTKALNQMKESNERQKELGREPYSLGLTGRIEVATWNHEMDLPDHDLSIYP